MSWVALILQFVLAIVLIAAATGKVFRPDDFRQAIRASGLPSRPIALLVPVLELGIAVSLLTVRSVALEIAFAASLALFAAFTAWVLWLLARKIRVRCGCFGSHNVEINYRVVARNVAFMMLAALGFLLTLSSNSVGQVDAVWKVAAALPLTLALMLILALRQVRTRLVLSLSDVDRLSDKSLTPQGGG
jgi:hypothetical protein